MEERDYGWVICNGKQTFRPSSSRLRSIIDTSCYRTLTLTRTFSVSMAGAAAPLKMTY